MIYQRVAVILLPIDRIDNIVCTLFLTKVINNMIEKIIREKFGD